MKKVKFALTHRPNCMRIRRDMQQKVRELDGRFRQIIQEYRAKGMLSDTPEVSATTVGCFPSPLNTNAKSGGSSTTESINGRTAFIEPEAVIEINNDLFDLEQDERREIFRILRDLSQTIRPYSHVIRQYLEVLVRFDVIQAKARLAMSMRAGMPILKEKPVIGIKKATTHCCT